MIKQSIIFMRRDTQIFGSMVDSFSTDRMPGVTWEIDHGVAVTLSRDVTDSPAPYRQIEVIPWANIAKLSVQMPLERDAPK